ncbi:MAG: radical SAM protein [Desulfobacteraceae bacterium]|nr:radical SAM protein [Desulfobacteraceae bacterium]
MDQNEHTQSLCPICLNRIPARRVLDGSSVYLEKQCPVHGDFSTVIWRGEPAFSKWKRPKWPSRPPVCKTEINAGCPFDCGLCPDHAQHTCTTLVEVTRRCNLNCPVCFAKSGNEVVDPDLNTIREQILSIRQSAGACTLQISGGEPTVRDDLPEIVSFAAGQGFALVQLNTNGLRFAEEPQYAETLEQAGLESVFLQFDAVCDPPYERLRGRPLWEKKKQAVTALARAGIGVVLVPTLVPGVNTEEAGAIIRFALSRHPAVRGVHFQPVSYFGRYPHTPADEDRLTLPELMCAIELQTQGLICTADFMPPGCEHALCSFHAAFQVTESGMLKRVGGGCCNTAPIEAAAGARQNVLLTGQRWRHPPAGTQLKINETDDLDRFLYETRTRSFTVSAMVFQDAWSLDLERLRGCCIHVSAPDGRLIPFCAYNITASEGQPLYRRINGQKPLTAQSKMAP